MICVTLEEFWSSSCMDLRGWEYLSTQALQGLGRRGGGRDGISWIDSAEAN